MEIYFDILPTDINMVVLSKLDIYDFITFINILDDNNYTSYIRYKYTYLNVLSDDILLRIFLKLNRRNLRNMYPLFLRSESLWKAYLFFKYTVKIRDNYADFGYQRLLSSIKHSYSLQVVIRVNETYTDVPILLDRRIVGVFPIFNSVTNPLTVLDPGFSYFNYVILGDHIGWELIYKKNLDNSFSWLSKPLGIPSTMILFDHIPIYIRTGVEDRLHTEDLGPRGRAVATLSKENLLQYLWMTTIFPSNTDHNIHQCSYYKCDITSKDLYDQYLDQSKMTIINQLKANLMRLGLILHR